MRHTIYYQGTKGNLDLSSLPFIYQESTLFDYEYTGVFSKSTDRRRNIISSISHYGVEKTLVIGVVDTKDYRDVMYKLEQAFEADNAREVWGKIVVNGSYINCMVLKSDKGFWNKGKRLNTVTLTLITETSLWTVEEKFEYSMYEANRKDIGFSFPNSFPTRFVQSTDSKKFYNGGVKETEARITIYGPIADPVVTIGGYPYAVYTELVAGDRLIIDTSLKRLVKIIATGESVNMFNYRDKKRNVFKKIRTGTNYISLNGNFSIEVVLLHERMEPSWK